MNADKWTNTRTLQEVGNNSALGTPRSWINRATGCKYQDLNQQDSSLAPGLITVGAVWFRPCSLPNTGSKSAIYRFFNFDPKFCGRGLGAELRPAIGMGVAVAADEIYQWRQQFQQMGAVWIWWSWPDSSAATVSQTESGRQVLNHEKIYEMFAAGLKIREVATQLEVNPNAIQYVHRKWKEGRSPEKLVGRRSPVNHASVAEDLRTGGFTMTEIADRNNTTRATVWKIKRKEGITT